MGKTSFGFISNRRFISSILQIYYVVLSVLLTSKTEIKSLIVILMVFMYAVRSQVKGPEVYNWNTLHAQTPSQYITIKKKLLV